MNRLQRRASGHRGRPRRDVSGLPVLEVTRSRIAEYLDGAVDGEVVMFVGMKMIDGGLRLCHAGEETEFVLRIIEDDTAPAEPESSETQH